MYNKNEVWDKLKIDTERIFHDYELDETTIPKKLETILEDYKVVAEWENVSEEEYEVLLKEVMGEMEDEYDYDIEYGDYITIEEDEDDDENDWYEYDPENMESNYDDFCLDGLTKEIILNKLKREIEAIYKELDVYDTDYDIEADIAEYEGEKVRNGEEFIEFIERFIHNKEDEYFTKIIRIGEEKYEVIWYTDDVYCNSSWDGPTDTLQEWVNDGWD